MAKRKPSEDVELVYSGASETTSYRINKNTTIPEDDSELWKDAVGEMTRQELQNAKTHFTLRIHGLQNVLDLINAKIGIREGVKKLKFAMPSRKSAQLAMRTSIRGMTARKRCEAFAQFSDKRREHYR